MQTLIKTDCAFTQLIHLAEKCIRLVTLSLTSETYNMYKQLKAHLLSNLETKQTTKIVSPIVRLRSFFYLGC